VFGFFRNRKNTRDLQEVVEKQLEKNMRVIESLRDYDTGKKDISTDTAEERLPGIRVAP
jgi:hypothetical protein